MKKLALIEWMKLRRSATAIAILSVFLVVIPLIFWMLTLIAIPVPEINYVWRFADSTFHAPESFHYVTYIGSWFNLMVGVIIIVFTTNEIKFRTQRQNIIDGLNKREIILSKFLVVFELTFIVTFYAFIISILSSLISGYDGNYLEGIEYIGYYFISSLGYFSFAFLFASLLKLPALATILYIVSTFVEGIATIPLGNTIKEFLPLRSFSDLIVAPILPNGNVDERILSDPQRCIVALVYIILFFLISFWVLKRRDI